MAIKVRVINVDPNHIEESQTQAPEEETAKILTPEYVAEVNRGITYRILEREAAFKFDPSTDKIIG